MGVKREKKAPEGAPGWIVTFADLMSLLLTFFVLILSFASIDKPKFKTAMGSIKQALGVQNKYLYQNQLNSNDPFETEFEIDSPDSMDQRREPQVLSAQANQFCQIEEDRKAKEQEYLLDVANTVVEKFKDNTVIKKFFKFKVSQGSFDVSLNQGRVFNDTNTVNKSGKSAFETLFKELPQERFDVHITNYAPKRASSSKEAFRSWIKTNERSLNVATVAQSIPAASRHNFIVESRTQKREPASDQSGKIDLKFKFREK